MFSHNGKISEKQMRRMLVLTTFASGIFVIPYLSARMFGNSVVTGLFFFLLFAILYATVLVGIGRNDKENEREIPAWFRVIQLIRQIVRLAFYIVLSIRILQEAQVPFMQENAVGTLRNLMVILPLLVVAIYGADYASTRPRRGETDQSLKTEVYLGIEKQGRICEMLFPVLFIPFLVMLVFGLGEVDPSIFIPHLDMPVDRLAFCAYGMLTFLQPLENYRYLNANLRGRKGSTRRTYISLLGIIVLICILALLLQGIFGIHGAGQEEMLTVSIMRYIRLPFGVLERFDVLMIWFLMTGCFVLISSTLFAIGEIWNGYVQTTKRIWILSAALLEAWILVMYLPDYAKTLTVFFCYGAWVDFPLSLFLQWKTAGR